MPAAKSNPTLFATTRWTLVCDAARGGDSAAVEALGALFGAYWQPLYRYLRRLGRSTHDAEDLVQGFLKIKTPPLTTNNTPPSNPAPAPQVPPHIRGQARIGTASAR